MTGSVSLIGAGPGDPDLITRRGLDLLRDAEVVVYDRLVNPDLIAEAPADAERINVGKTPNGPSATQEEIHRVLLEHAHAGKRVVRLKGGDPFIYGRGWEELVACRIAGIECEVVPGITSAIAGAAAADIPVTARGIARSFLVITARGGDNQPAHTLDYQTLATVDTACVLMGRAELPAIASGVIDAGRAPDTPVALIERATLPGQRVLRATLANIAQRADEADIRPPVLTVIGDVANLAPYAGDARSLEGLRVLVTRPRDAARPITRMLRARGADVTNIPAITIRIRDDAQLPEPPGDFDWIVFTSKHAVTGLFETLTRVGLDARALAGPRIATVGPSTANALRQSGIHADLIPDEYRATALTSAIKATGDLNGARVLFPCGSRALDEIPRTLSRAGAVVTKLDVYETLFAPLDVPTVAALHRELDAALFHAPSGVRAIAAAGFSPAPTTLIGCIGSTTAQAAREAGWRVHITAEDHTDEGLVHALERAVSAEVVG